MRLQFCMNQSDMRQLDMVFVTGGLLTVNARWLYKVDKLLDIFIHSLK